MGCACTSHTNGTIQFLFTLWIDGHLSGIDTLEEKLEVLKCGYDRLTEIYPCTEEQEGEYELSISQDYSSTTYSHAWSDYGCDPPETVEEMEFSIDEVAENLKESLKSDTFEVYISNPSVHYH